MSAPVLISGGEAGDPEFNDPLLPHLLDAIARCGEGSRIELCVSFIRQSGLVLLRGALHEALARGARLRVITSDYLEVTQPVALRELLKFDPARSCALIYQSQGNRGFHLKSYLFVQHAAQYLGEQVGQEGSPAVLGGQAFLGSSNISAAALTESLEWNWSLRAEPSGPSEPHHSLRQLAAQIERLAQDARVVLLTHDWIDGYLARYRQSALRELRVLTGDHRSSAEQLREAPIPNSVQQEALMALQAARAQGHKRGVVVMATGLGKTWLAAFDVRQMQAARLLFVAHREEILKQSLYTFRAVLKDANFGELYVGSHRADSIDHLFVSIQTFNSQELAAKTAADFYDYIVVDEFHHAAAPTYQKLLEYYQPKILLGLTATPERMDGKSVLDYFGGRIAAEIRLPEAIDRKLLCPFQYFGVTDTADLSSLKWRTGGYDKNELSNLYTLSGMVAERRADLVVNSILKYVTDIDEVKGLGFCVSIAHAQFMARYFNTHGIPSMALTGDSPDEERNAAKQRLVSGELRFLFVVDIYNEGVDIPEVNTVLFLRPTESLTVFLQQLGRGLRLAENKDCLTVLDFIGQANKKYNFEEKFAALLSNTTRSVSREIKEGFVSAPKGCYIQLEKIAAKYVLDNISASYDRTSGLVARAATFTEDTGLPLTLGNFLDYYHLDPRAIYSKKVCFSRLCVRAGAASDFAEPLEETMTKALARFAVVDSRRWIRFLLELLPKLDNTDFAALSPVEKRMLQMFYVTLWGKTAESWEDEEVLDNLYALSDSPVLLGELQALLQYQYDRIDFIDEPVDVGFDCPLDLHCTYTRDQLLVALDFLKPATVREGVKWLPEKQLDVFFVTLNKADKDYSPTTMYKDYSINESLFHWQSQSTTAENSATGQRYIHHRAKGSRVLLFVREFKADARFGGAGAYTYLGTVNYVKHEGSRPMNITWRLDRPIPAKFLKKTNKLVVG